MGTTPVGRALVGLYYALSPPIAGTLARHPGARTTRAVRWLVERCADLARRRDAASSWVVRLAHSILLTIAYAVGLAIGVVGHGCIRAAEAIAGGAGSAVGHRPVARAGQEARGEAADHRRDSGGD